MMVCAEVGLQHCGCLGTAYSFVAAVAGAGASAVKFQCHAGDPVDQFRPGSGVFPQDGSRQDFWRRTLFSREQYAGLSGHARDLGLEFGCSAFALEGVELMRGLVDWWKVPSGCIDNRELVAAMEATGQPLVFSSGMSGWSEAWDALFAVRADYPVTLLQCTSMYPCPPDKVGLNQLSELKDWGELNRWGWGLSDHSGTIWPGLAAATLGADMLEVHVCWDKRQWGPDVAASLTIDQLEQLCDGARWISEANANPVSKDAVAGELSGLRQIFRAGRRRVKIDA